MTAANYDATNAAASPFGGVVKESVMNKIWDISNIPLPLTDMISKGTHDNQRVEWIEDELGVPATDNATIDSAGFHQNDSVAPTRLGNFSQTAIKEVQISTRAQASAGYGNNTKLSYQISQRQIELRRDIEAQMLTYQASLPGDGTTAAVLSAGLGAQLKTNVDTNSGTAGGFNTSTGVFDAPIPGVARALSETLIRDILQGIYTDGGNTDCMMAVPAVVRKLSAYLFSDTAAVATLTAEQSQASPRALTAYGSVNVFVSDFGQTIKILDNRIQQDDDTDESTVYFIDPSHLTQSFLTGYNVVRLAKTGLYDRRLMSADYSLKCYSEKSQGAIYAIDNTADVVA